MSNNEIPVGPHTKALMDRIMTEGNESATFTQEEKLALVADGLMDPKAVGLVSAEEAHLQIVPDEEKKKEPELGNELIFRCGCVPLELRAEWAYKDTKIILAPADKTAWKEKWIEDNKNTYRIQGQMNCGTLGCGVERTFKDPILGMAQLLRVAADALEAYYTKNKLPKLTDEHKPDEPVIDEPNLP